MKKGETKAVTIKEKPNSVDKLISEGLASNANVETMERLFSLRERVKAEQGKEEFVRALSKFQEECPVIVKTKEVLNKNGTTVRYKFAPIDSIVEQIKKPLTRAGLSYTWTVKNDEKSVTATCKVTHILGHSEESSFTIPIDTEGYMTAPQKVASALTFAKRYSLCNALGISTGDEDTDATDVKKEKEALSEKSKLIFLLKTLGEKHGTKEEIEEAVLRLAKLDLSDENLPEIRGRLEILVKERNEDN